MIYVHEGEYIELKAAKYARGTRILWLPQFNPSKIQINYVV